MITLPIKMVIHVLVILLDCLRPCMLVMTLTLSGKELGKTMFKSGAQLGSILSKGYFI